MLAALVPPTAAGFALVPLIAYPPLLFRPFRLLTPPN